MKLETCRVDTDVRSSHVVPCVELIAESPWDGVSSPALAFPCCHHGVSNRHSRHEGAARAAGTLERQLIFLTGSLFLRFPAMVGNLPLSRGAFGQLGPDAEAREGGGACA